MKLKTTAAAVFLALAATTVQAGTFDPDGPGGDAPINLGTLDWGPTGFLASGGNTAIANFVGSGGTCPTNSCTFSVLTQAKLLATLNPVGTPNTPAGLNNTYEITMVARFNETVTAVSGTGGVGTSATFAAIPNSGFLQIYFGSTVNANDVTGFGFSDGRLILNGQLANGPTGTFTITANDPLVCAGGAVNPCPLDSHTGTPDQYPGQGTVSGTGSNGVFQFAVTGQDPAFFVQQLANLGLQYANISISLPYTSVDPGDCYNANAAYGGAIGTTNTSVCDNNHVFGLLNPATQPGPGVIPNVGVINGLLQAGGTDFVSQTDFNSPVSFAATVPEPGTIALLGLGLFGIGFGLRRKTD